MVQLPLPKHIDNDLVTEAIGTAVLVFGILAIAANAQTFAKPGDTRADGFPMPNGSLNTMNLIMRPVGAPGTYSTVASVGEGAQSIKLTPGPAPTPLMIWSSQATDDNLHNSLQSNVTITGLSEDADEPNGSTKPGHATVLTLPAVNRPETNSPAGESAFFEISAKTGDVIDVAATHTGALDGDLSRDRRQAGEAKPGSVLDRNTSSLP
jgi:hypothetical protein